MKHRCLLGAAWLFLSLSYNLLHAKAPPIIIAIVDDAFDIEHPLFNGMLWHNPNEIANNNKDDDGNGQIDDLHGWDVSDLDENISAPIARQAEFSHGDTMAGVIATQIKLSLGEMDEYPIKLMLVKAISDSANNLSMKDGYDGINYALANNANLINLSWSGGVPDNKAKQSLALARQTDTVIVSSVGTYPQKEASMPAAHPAVIGIAGVDKSNKLYLSNYGEEVDIAAPALYTMNQETLEGVSISTALVTATLALMKLQDRSADTSQLRHCLQKTATPLDEYNPEKAGQLGAGLARSQASISCIKDLKESHTEKGHYQAVSLREHAKGSIRHQITRNSKNNSQSWSINPNGNYNGIRIKPYIDGDAGKSELEIKSLGDKKDIIWTGLLSDIPTEIASEHSAVMITLSSKSNKPFLFVVNYATQNIDFPSRYCQGKKSITLESSAKSIFIEDGSEKHSYAAGSNCKWLLSPPQGHNIKLEFLEFDTEITADSLHLFRGDTTEQANFLMKITGDTSPPSVLVERDPVMLWFTSDEQRQGQGFRIKASAIKHNRK